MPDFTPLPVPSPQNEEHRNAQLSEEEEKKRQEVLAHFDKDDYNLPDEEKGSLTDEEKMWLSNDCILRYLRATKWHSSAAAIKRIEETLKWRRSFGFHDERQSAEHVEPEAVTGKEVIYGYDTKGRPGFYMIPSRQNTTESERQIQFNVWMMERAIDLMGPGVESLDLLINFADRSKNPSIGTARAVLHIIQAHYPERLGLANIINVPMLVNMFFKVIMPFVDPVTRAKVKFNPRVIEEGIFEPSQIMREYWGGERDFEYDHSRYWPALVSMTQERRERMMQRWKELGSKVGTSEWDMKTGWLTETGTTTSVSAVQEKMAETAEVTETEAPIAVVS